MAGGTFVSSGGGGGDIAKVKGIDGGKVIHTSGHTTPSLGCTNTTHWVNKHTESREEKHLATNFMKRPQT